jgi:hypothetical protein
MVRTNSSMSLLKGSTGDNTAMFAMGEQLCKTVDVKKGKIHESLS